MGLNVYSINENGVKMEVMDNTVTISGMIDCKDPGSFMSLFFEEVHSSAIRKQIKEVCVDITKLNFLNSSGIKEFVVWIMKLSELPDNQKYALKFICASDVKWQELSIGALVLLNSDFVSHEIV